MTSSNPPTVKIARKRGAEDQEPPSTLIVRSGEGEQGPRPVYYVRQSQDTGAHKRRDISTRELGDGKAGNGVGGDARFAPKTGRRNELGHRLFELRTRHLQPTKKTAGRKRGRGKDDVATFVELRQGREKGSWGGSPGPREKDVMQVEQYAGATERPLKRPSRQPRIRKEQDGEGGMEVSKPQTEAETRQLESLAQYLHEASLDELKTEREREREREREKRKAAPTMRDGGKVSAPKISGQRAKEMHRRRVESNQKLQPGTQRDHDGDMDISAGDYIYDTYVLATAPSSASFILDTLSPNPSDVGYLIIAPSDRDVWEAYIDDLPTSDEDANSDSDDSNAEDYYGADYPEDELSEDDEFDRGAAVYGYRGGAGAESDGDRDVDGYDSDRGVWSEGEGSEGEVERMMNPFKCGHRNGSGGQTSGGVMVRY